MKFVGKSLVSFPKPVTADKKIKQLTSSLSGNRNLLFKRLLFLRGILLTFCAAAVGLEWFLPETPDRQSPMLAVLLVGIGLSVFVWYRYRKHSDFSDGFLAWQLFVDVVLLVCLVWFNGRSTNPFIYYLLVVIAVSASILPGYLLWAFSLGGIAIYTFLMYFDFNAHILHMPHDFQLHLLGMWLNFVGSALLISFFISRLTTALRDREIQLAAVREETLKNEQLIGIGTLAASTVHSLGTPLSTIAVSLGELKNEINLSQKHNHSSSEQTHYLELIQSQVERCKQIMSKLSLLANSDAEDNQQNTLGNLVEDIKEYFLLVNATPQPDFVFDTSQANQSLPGNLLLKHALSNLIDNAVHAAHTKVNVAFTVQDAHLEVCIEDDGVGIPANIASSFGKPVTSTKEEGLGIGIFLANSTIEKLNGSVSFYSDGKEETSTRVVVSIPLTGVNKSKE